MPKFNLTANNDIDTSYGLGLLPQRNSPGLFYQDTSCRSNLSLFSLSSENRRIIKKTEEFTFSLIPLSEFNFNFSVQKTCHQWVTNLGWKFPTASIKTVFTKHIFNYLYIWKNSNQEIVAYSICYFSPNISHIAYVFYHPQYDHGNLPIRLTLQAIIDSHQKNLKYCYLGRFSPPTTGYYKRSLPGFEYYLENNWIKYNSK